MLSWVFCLLLSSTSGSAFRSLPEAMRPNVVKMFNISSMSDLEVDVFANASAALTNTSLADIESDNRTHALQLLHRERKKQERLISIQTQILQNLHLNRQPNISTSIFSADEQLTYAKLIEKMNKVEENTVDGLILMRSFYASCSVPNNTDRFSWEEDTSFRLFYDLPFNSYPSDVTIKTATLRLFKRAIDDVNTIYREPCPAQNINVNIYQNLKPLRTNRKERKRLVDSKTVSLDQKGWVEFNVASSLNYWFNHNNRNFGFSIEVEDGSRNKLNPNLYFDSMNCTLDTLPYHPFPNILDMEGEKIVSQFFNNDTYPTLDLRTSEPFRGLHSLAEDRVRRSADNSTCTGELEYISFADVGLDEYIVWPTGVVWTFCEGTCSPQDTSNSRETFFAQWIQRLFKVRRKNSESNCVVTRRESLPALLYDGENQVFETVLEDFVPTNCGCRPS